MKANQPSLGFGSSSGNTMTLNQAEQIKALKQKKTKKGKKAVKI